MAKNHLQLSDCDREYLQELTQKKNMGVGVWRRVQGLLALDGGQSLHSVALSLGVCYVTVSKWRDRYRQDGLALLQDKPRSGRPPQIDGAQRAKITALACSTPPQGRAHWSLRLLQGKAVELGYVEQISHDSVHQILKKTTSSRT